MKLDKLEKLYLEAVYDIEYSKDVEDLLKRTSKALFLFLKLIYRRKAEISRALGREITRFLYVEEDVIAKMNRLEKIVSLMRYEAVSTKYPFVDFYMQNFVSEMDRLMATKGYKFLTFNTKP